MQGLIHIEFWICNIIFEPSGYRFPNGVDDPKYRIAALNIFNNDPYCYKVINIIYVPVLFRYLIVNTVKTLAPAADVCRNLDFV
jgi:hypothetical protein